MITSNVIHRVFHIKYDEYTATAFSIDIDAKQYIVTAKHVVADIGNEGTIHVLSNGSWAPIQTRLVGHAEGDIDISVLATDTQLTPVSLPLEASSDGLTYGQDVFFLGFPYGIQTKFIFGDEGYPLPFVKRALLSCFNGPVYLLDGHNNPGFSGGPVVFSQSGNSVYKVAAVISGFEAVAEPIFVDNGERTPLVYKYNTGVIISYSIENAVALIKNKPIGFKLANNTA